MPLRPKIRINYYDYIENQKEIAEQLWYEFGSIWLELELPSWRNWDGTYFNGNNLV